MKIKVFAILTLIVLLPFIASAQSFPSYPMSFYGNVRVNDNLAPVGSIIKAYYGSDISGEFRITTDGKYGSTNMYYKQFLVREGAGNISFGITSSGFNGGKEIKAREVYDKFETGKQIKKTLIFEYEVPKSNPNTDTNNNNNNNDSNDTNREKIEKEIADLNRELLKTKSKKQATITVEVNQDYIKNKISELQAELLKVRQAELAQLLASTTCTDLKQNVNVGAKDGKIKHVSLIQNFLYQTKYLKQNSTGYFGALTKTAILAFQKNNGLAQVGSVGTMTRAKIKKMTCNRVSSK